MTRQRDAKLTRTEGAGEFGGVNLPSRPERREEMT